MSTLDLAAWMSLIFVILFIPTASGVGIIIGKRRVQENRRRLAAYRASPESHILNLHD